MTLIAQEAQPQNMSPVRLRMASVVLFLLTCAHPLTSAPLYRVVDLGSDALGLGISAVGGGPVDPDARAGNRLPGSGFTVRNNGSISINDRGQIAIAAYDRNDVRWYRSVPCIRHIPCQPDCRRYLYVTM
jgi:hypothetical protein